MPYKTSGRRVYVQKGGKWQLLKEHPSKAAARAHAAALRANVKK